MSTSSASKHAQLRPHAIDVPLNAGVSAFLQAIVIIRWCIPPRSSNGTARHHAVVWRGHHATPHRKVPSLAVLVPRRRISRRFSSKCEAAERETTPPQYDNKCRSSAICVLGPVDRKVSVARPPLFGTTWIYGLLAMGHGTRLMVASSDAGGDGQSICRLPAGMPVCPRARSAVIVPFSPIPPGARE